MCSFIQEVNEEPPPKYEPNKEKTLQQILELVSHLVHPFSVIFFTLSD